MSGYLLQSECRGSRDFSYRSPPTRPFPTRERLEGPFPCFGSPGQAIQPEARRHSDARAPLSTARADHQTDGENLQENDEGSEDTRAQTKSRQIVAQTVEFIRHLSDVSLQPAALHV